VTVSSVQDERFVTYSTNVEICLQLNKREYFFICLKNKQISRYNCGYAINPARDFGPRIFTSFEWGYQVWTLGDNFFWIPIVGPMVGSLIATIFYTLIVSNNWEEETF